jgi:hypothetical protein
MDLEVFLIESAAWLVFAVLLILMIGNRYDCWPWGRRRPAHPQQAAGYQRLA